MSNTDVDSIRAAISRLRNWGRQFHRGGGAQSIVIADIASEALDRVEERLKPQQGEMWEIKEIEE